MVDLSVALVVIAAIVIIVVVTMTIVRFLRATVDSAAAAPLAHAPQRGAHPPA